MISNNAREKALALRLLTAPMDPLQVNFGPSILMHLNRNGRAPLRFGRPQSTLHMASGGGLEKLLLDMIFCQRVNSDDQVE